MIRALVGIIIVATLVGVMMPARAPKVEAGAKAAAPAADAWFADGASSYSSATSSSRGRNGVNVGSDVSLTRQADGHFYADVEVNGTPIEFLIDTGATGIAMTDADARRAGVMLDASQKTYVGEGAGGSLTGQMVKLDRVKLGPRSDTSVTAVVIDGSSSNLLGQSFLSKFAEVTVRGDVMTMR
jgi:aspartyl protease family protein